MIGSRTHTSLGVTLLVGVATVFALALPEGNGGRDSVVRLTRGGLHRIGCPESATCGHDDHEAAVTPSREPQPDPTAGGGTPLVALLTAPLVVFAPEWQSVAPVRGAPVPGPSAPSASAPSDRAPPTR